MNWDWVGVVDKRNLLRGSVWRNAGEGLSSAVRRSDSVSTSNGAGGSVGIGSSFCPRLKPGNRHNRFGEAERAESPLIRGSALGC